MAAVVFMCHCRSRNPGVFKVCVRSLQDAFYMPFVGVNAFHPVQCMINRVSVRDVCWKFSVLVVLSVVFHFLNHLLMLIAKFTRFFNNGVTVLPRTCVPTFADLISRKRPRGIFSPSGYPSWRCNAPFLMCAPCMNPFLEKPAMLQGDPFLN